MKENESYTAMSFIHQVTKLLEDFKELSSEINKSNLINALSILREPPYPKDVHFVKGVWNFADLSRNQWNIDGALIASGYFEIKKMWCMTVRKIIRTRYYFMKIRVLWTMFLKNYNNINYIIAFMKA